MNKIYNSCISKLNIDSDIYFNHSLSFIKSYSRYNPTITINTKFNIKSKGLLANIPIDIKDNIVTKNILTTAGSKILNNFIPTYNATVVEKLIMQGAHIISKSNMEEFGQGGVGDNIVYGDIHNPHNYKHISGGSSSGAAVLVATGCVPISIATDTGDSIRQPAACCGIIGFKPTWGRISRYGVIPYCPSLDTVGILGRRIDDISYIYDIIAERDNLDLTTIKDNKNNSYSKLNKKSLKDLKVLFIKNIDKKLTNDEYIQLYSNFKNKLLKNGCKLIEKTIDEELYKYILFAYRVISNSESISCISNFTGLSFGNRKVSDNWKKMYIETRSKGFSYKVKLRLLLGLYSTEKEHQNDVYLYYLKIRRLLDIEYKRLLKDVDVLVMPFQENGAPIMKSSLDTKYENLVKGEANFIDDNLLLANMSGSPSLMMPIGYLNKSLPVSISLNCKYKDDVLLLQIANKFCNLINFENKLIKKDE